jgi:dUTP pyrophosphatase
MLINGVGVIDSDFIHETHVLLYNTSDGPITIGQGDRIAQAMLEKTEQYQFEEISEAPTQKTSRSGGFGSTGT